MKQINVTLGPWWKWNSNRSVSYNRVQWVVPSLQTPSMTCSVFSETFRKRVVVDFQLGYLLGKKYITVVSLVEWSPILFFSPELCYQKTRDNLSGTFLSSFFFYFSKTLQKKNIGEQRGEINLSSFNLAIFIQSLFKRHANLANLAFKLEHC